MNELISKIGQTDFFKAAMSAFYKCQGNDVYELKLIERDDLIFVVCADMDKEFPDTKAIVIIDPNTGSLLSANSGDVLGNVLTDYSDTVIERCGFKKSQ